MKDYSRRIYLSIFWMVLGAILFVMGVIGKLDSFWSGMGGALIAVGGLQTIRWSKYRRNEDYRESFDTQANDERNRFISSKAWAWSGYANIMAGAVGIIVFKLIGYEQLSTFCACAVCLLMLLYWLFYMLLSRKY